MWICGWSNEGLELTIVHMCGRCRGLHRAPGLNHSSVPRLSEVKVSLNPSWELLGESTSGGVF